MNEKSTPEGLNFQRSFLRQFRSPKTETWLLRVPVAHSRRPLRPALLQASPGLTVARQVRRLFCLIKAPGSPTDEVLRYFAPPTVANRSPPDLAIVDELRSAEKLF